MDLKPLENTADWLLDVMQASLPKAIRMISVDDLGQGSESVRILGVRWLPTGAASQSASASGKLQSPKSQEVSDRTNPGEGQVDEDVRDDDNSTSRKDGKKETKEKKTQEQEEENTAEGMEAEQGDFVNMEIAFAYRAKASGKSLRTKAKNAHIYLAFYLYAGMKVPVWVEMKGTTLASSPNRSKLYFDSVDAYTLATLARSRT